MVTFRIILIIIVLNGNMIHQSQSCQDIICNINSNCCKNKWDEECLVIYYLLFVCFEKEKPNTN